METLIAAIVAIGSVVATKALEKTGEEVGDVLFEKTRKFLSSLKKHSPDTVTAIEKASEQSLDYGQAVLEIQSFADANPEVNQTMQELAAATETNPPSNLAEILKEIEEAVNKSQKSYPLTFIQNIEKAVNAAQKQIIDQRGATFNF